MTEAKQQKRPLSEEEKKQLDWIWEVMLPGFMDKYEKLNHEDGSPASDEEVKSEGSRTGG